MGKKGKITGNKIHGIENLCDQQSNPFEIKVLEGSFHANSNRILNFSKLSLGIGLNVSYLT